ncbi:MAG TPA: VOC family protein [Bryobacteraceae bacterium]|nr:VOC family protein [Bryobacteraceae bacterium]
MNLQLHHVGMVVADIAAASELYCRRFGYTRQTDAIHDPKQQAIVQLLRLPGDAVYLELAAPDTPASPLQAALAHKPLHHLCYSAADIEEACRKLETQGLTLISPPVEAIAFGGRRIAWLMGKDRLLVELVEAGASLG